MHKNVLQVRSSAPCTSKTNGYVDTEYLTTEISVVQGRPNAGLKSPRSPVKPDPDTKDSQTANGKLGSVPSIDPVSLISKGPESRYAGTVGKTTLPFHDLDTHDVNECLVSLTEEEESQDAGTGDRDNDGAVHETETGGEELKEIDIEVYKSRLWILGVFSYFAFVTVLIWGTFGPILESSKFVFGWNDGYVALLTGCGSIFSIVGMIPLNWLASKFGLRVGMLLASSLMAVAAGVRCITTNNTVFTYVASLAAILNGLGSCLAFSLPAMISSTWFPPKERATATAVGALATQLGGAGMYFSPLIVRTPSPELDQDQIKDDISILMYIHFGLALLSFLSTLLYFPEKPPKPPSVSSSVERIDYLRSIALLLRTPQVMCVVFVYVFSMSIPLSWISVMDLSLGCLGITQKESMWIAITACTASPVMAFLMARLTDHLHGNMKASIVGLLLGSFCFFLWVLIITEELISASFIQVFIAIVFAISLQYSSIPLLIELTAELSYPCPESAVGALLSFLTDSVGAMFLLLMMIPSQCFHWISYALVGSFCLTILPMLFVKEVHRRSVLDQDTSEV